MKAFVLDTARYLADSGAFEVTVVCDGDASFGELIPPNVRYLPVSMKRGINLAGIGAVLSLRALFSSEKFDIVQYSTPNASLYAALASWMAGVGVRLYCQWGIVYVGFSGIKRRIFRRIEKMVCTLSTWIEPDSEGNRRFSVAEGLYADTKSSVVWNGSASGVDLRKFDIASKNVWRTETRGRLGIPDQAVVVGFVGRMSRDKGMNELLLAIRRMMADTPQLYLMLVGGIEINHRIEPELLSWAEGEKRVVFCGRTSEVEKHLAAMDLFALPSYREGFGSVVIEAEAMGVPVVVSDIPGPTDAMLPGTTGELVRKGDSDSLRVVLQNLMDNPERAHAMSEEAVRYVRSRFDQGILFEKIMEDRLRLCARRGKA